jgi:hypothetical protein
MISVEARMGLLAGVKQFSDLGEVADTWETRGLKGLLLPVLWRFRCSDPRDKIYADQGKLVEAEQMYQRALQGYEKAWGPDHTSTLDTVKTWQPSTPTRASWSRPSRCISGRYKGTRRRSVQIISSLTSQR